MKRKKNAMFFGFLTVSPKVKWKKKEIIQNTARARAHIHFILQYPMLSNLSNPKREKKTKRNSSFFLPHLIRFIHCWMSLLTKYVRTIQNKRYDLHANKTNSSFGPFVFDYSIQIRFLFLFFSLQHHGNANPNEKEILEISDWMDKECFESIQWV